MKQKYTTKYTKRKGFSLLELLVVVAILAIIGGAVITAYDGLVSQSQKATATNTIGSLTNTIRQFKVVEGNYPNNWESLLQATPKAQGVFEEASGDTILSAVDLILKDDTTQPLPDTANLTIDDAGWVPTYVQTLQPLATGETATANGINTVVDSYGIAGILASKIADKFEVKELTDAQTESLAKAGITKLRYTHTAGIAGGELTNIFTANNESEPTVGPVSEISIPQHAFEAPREDKAGTKTRNRGRGFVVSFGENTTGVTAAVWKTDTTFGYNNIKVGAKPNAVLVGLGIGNANTLVNPSFSASSQSSGVGSISLATAPFYGDVAKNSYQHYVALFDVSQTPAVFVAVVDSRGDFLDEEFAESTGQKK